MIRYTDSYNQLSEKIESLRYRQKLRDERMEKEKEKKEMLNEDDKIIVGYALGMLYQFLEDDIAGFRNELKDKEYSDIITLDKILELKTRLGIEG